MSVFLTQSKALQKRNIILKYYWSALCKTLGRCSWNDWNPFSVCGWQLPFCRSGSFPLDQAFHLKCVTNSCLPSPRVAELPKMSAYMCIQVNSQFWNPNKPSLNYMNFCRTKCLPRSHELGHVRATEIQGRTPLLRAHLWDEAVARLQPRILGVSYDLSQLLLHKFQGNLIMKSNFKRIHPQKVAKTSQVVVSSTNMSIKLSYFFISISYQSISAGKGASKCASHGWLVTVWFPPVATCAALESTTEATKPSAAATATTWAWTNHPH